MARGGKSIEAGDETRDPTARRLIEQVERLRADPGDVANVAELARAAGVGRARLQELVRRCYHRTPADLLARLRIGRARQLLAATDRPVADIALDVGVGTSSDLDRHLLRFTGLSPGDFRALRGVRSFALRLPAWLALAPIRRYWGRDPSSLTERVDGDRLRFTFGAGRRGLPAIVSVRIEGRTACCTVDGPGRLPASAAREAHAMLIRLFGIDRDPRPFERRAGAEPRMAALMAGQRGLVVPQTRDVFEGLLWVVAGQQVSLASAFAMRRRLIARTGRPVADGLVAPPTPRAVAALETGDLRAMGFSARKAQVILAAARDVVAGRIDLEIDFAVATAVERSLLDRSGFGPWSVGYLMMRVWGFSDCVPLGDVALLRRLAEVYALSERPDVATTERMLAPFSPDRSLATFHLWHRPEKPIG